MEERTHQRLAFSELTRVLLVALGVEVPLEHVVTAAALDCLPTLMLQFSEGNVGVVFTESRRVGVLQNAPSEVLPGMTVDALADIMFHLKRTEFGFVFEKIEVVVFGEGVEEFDADVLVVVGVGTILAVFAAGDFEEVLAVTDLVAAGVEVGLVLVVRVEALGSGEAVATELAGVGGVGILERVSTTVTTAVVKGTCLVVAADFLGTLLCLVSTEVQVFNYRLAVGHTERYPTDVRLFGVLGPSASGNGRGFVETSDTATERRQDVSPLHLYY